MSDLIPEKLKRFLTDYIDSIAELEAMLFLRQYPNRSWSCRLVAEWIYLSEEDTTSLLAKLTKKGLITANEISPGSFQYRPHNQEVAQLIDQLAETYAKYLVPITNLIHTKSRRNIESLADAFKFKKEQ